MGIKAPMPASVVAATPQDFKLFCEKLPVFKKRSLMVPQLFRSNWRSRRRLKFCYKAKSRQRFRCDSTELGTTLAPGMRAAWGRVKTEAMWRNSSKQNWCRVENFKLVPDGGGSWARFKTEAAWPNVRKQSGTGLEVNPGSG
ncbi:hypothetical protein COLO4_00237 [Corchorus olitorius]|uniref:Uncharacterized protein n=1 Tax=Corchorus olitorius TaxID=93759 RepID=A0A1R3L4A1_9ROSI|nr:hypothetical protein COLO4_00237 [Corchorus olitorius]